MTLKYGMTSFTSKHSAKHTKITSLDVHSRDWRDPWRTQIDTEFVFSAAILDVRNSLSIAFLAISDRFATLIFFEFLTKWLPAAILDVRNSLSIEILAISDRYRICFFGGNFGCLKIT